MKRPPEDALLELRAAVVEAVQYQAAFVAAVSKVDRLVATLVPDETPAAAAGVVLRREPEADDWIEIGAAAQRFNRPKDTIRRWCREHGIGRKSGGNWQVSAQRLSALRKDT